MDLLHRALAVELSGTFTQDGRSLVKERQSTEEPRAVAVPAHVLPAIADHLARFTASEADAIVLTCTIGAAGVLQEAWHRARLAIGQPELHLHDRAHRRNLACRCRQLAPTAPHSRVSARKLGL
ncbi:MAG: hypothetical protein ACYCXY_08625 [Acidimicrobiales bacterium]